MAKLKTGRHTSAIKEKRKSSKRKAWNSSLKNEISSLTRKLKASVNKKDLETAKTLQKKIHSLYDKAVKKGVYHINKASRKKSQTSRLLSIPAPK